MLLFMAYKLDRSIYFVKNFFLLKMVSQGKMLDRNYQTGLFIVRLKFQKQSVLKFVSRTIPRSGGYATHSACCVIRIQGGGIPVITDIYS